MIWFYECTILIHSILKQNVKWLSCRSAVKHNHITIVHMNVILIIIINGHVVVNRIELVCAWIARHHDTGTTYWWYCSNKRQMSTKRRSHLTRWCPDDDDHDDNGQQLQLSSRWSLIILISSMWCLDGWRQWWWQQWQQQRTQGTYCGSTGYFALGSLLITSPHSAISIPVCHPGKIYSLARHIFKFLRISIKSPLTHTDTLTTHNIKRKVLQRYNRYIQQKTSVYLVL